jgi:FMN phosphatase YigB (HAD superfamily)
MARDARPKLGVEPPLGIPPHNRRSTLKRELSTPCFQTTSIVQSSRFRVSAREQRVMQQIPLETPMEHGQANEPQRQSWVMIPIKNSHIHTVFFDIGNTLLDFDFGVAARRLSAMTGRPEPEVTWAMATLVERTRYELGWTTSEEFIRCVSAHFGLSLGRAEFRDVWSDIFTENDEMIALARALRGVKPRYLLSNTNDLHAEFFTERYPFIREFDGHIYSHLEGVGKPDPGIYRRALERAQTDAAHSLFIDDREENILAARQLGMNAVHYADRTQAMKEIRQCLQLD